MKRLIWLGIVALALIVTVQGCRKDPDLDATADAVRFRVPQGWPQPMYLFIANPLTKEGFELGRRLFYDPRLSRDMSTSCGSCHQQFAAFANADHIISHGVDGRLGSRNSPGIANMAWSPTLFWDGGVNHLELQPIAPITNPLEMDVSLDTVVTRLQADPDMRARYLSAFGTDEITTQRTMWAMAQFMAMIISDHSRYDQISRGEEGTAFSESESRGQMVFQQNCQSCHVPPLFTDFSFQNNGLAVTAANDSGRARITLLADDLYKFKVPSLRNLSYTAPYFHDGRATTLDDVLNHYATGIHASPTLAPRLAGGVALTTQERDDLKAFLKTLDDEVLLNDARFSEVH